MLSLLLLDLLLYPVLLALQTVVLLLVLVDDLQLLRDHLHQVLPHAQRLQAQVADRLRVLVQGVSLPDERVGELLLQLGLVQRDHLLQYFRGLLEFGVLLMIASQ